MRKGFVETATVIVLISLIASLASMGVATNSFMNVIGMQADSNDAERVEESIANPVRDVCVEGDGADREPTFSSSSKINVTFASEGDASENLENDPENDQVVVATKYDSATMIWEDSDVIPDCEIRYTGVPEYLNYTQYTFEEGEDYVLEIENQGGSEVYVDVSS